MKKFYQLPRQERIEYLMHHHALDSKDADLLKSSSSDNIQNLFDKCIECNIGSFPLPLGVCSGLYINGKRQWLALAVEETSVIAALNRSSQWLTREGKLQLNYQKGHKIGQLLFGEFPPEFDQIIQNNQKDWIDKANQSVAKSMFQRGGGLKNITIRNLNVGKVLHLHIDTCDSMGANLINQVCEWLKKHLRSYELYADVAILSNLSTERLYGAEISLPCSEKLGLAIQKLSEFAKEDPYRACTHNKGIMNAVDGLMIATGNDWRGVSAACHAYAAKDGNYSGLSTWKYQAGQLHGSIRLPIQLGTVGGMTKLNPVAALCLTLMDIQDAHHLSKIATLAGLLQNLSALRALADEGIVKGHMKLHIDNMVLSACKILIKQTELKNKLANQLHRDGYINLSNINKSENP